MKKQIPENSEIQEIIFPQSFLKNLFNKKSNEYVFMPYELNLFGGTGGCR